MTARPAERFAGAGRFASWFVGAALVLAPVAMIAGALSRAMGFN